MTNYDSSFPVGVLTERLLETIFTAKPLLNDTAPVHTVRLPPIQGPQRYEYTCDYGATHYEYA